MKKGRGLTPRTIIYTTRPYFFPNSKIISKRPPVARNRGMVPKDTIGEINLQKVLVFAKKGFTKGLKYDII